jgi:hypothetical protein
MKSSVYLIAAFICLLTGAAIYLIYTPSVLFIHYFLSASTITDLQKKLFWLQHLLPGNDFVRYHLPDILWYQSLLWVLAYIYHIKKIFDTGWVFYCTLFLPFIHELLQLTGIVAGTFDIEDILYYTMLLLLNYSLYFRKNKSDETKTPPYNP